LGGIGTPSLQALATRKVSAAQQGQFQGVLASAVSLSSIIAPLGFSSVYFAVQQSWPGAIWLCVVAVYIVAVPLVIVGTRRPGTYLAARALWHRALVRAEDVVEIVAVAARLLPRDHTGPGALDAHVDLFLTRAVADPRLGEVVPLLEAGAGFLARARFHALAEERQDALIDEVRAGVVDGYYGADFIRVVLVLTLEGFFGDPKHGGNHDEIGWRFAGFSPRGRAR
ncbi:MAG TPA: gluconate 2-dehydrogenase subunit 3 family protein, partial [Myxococcota bacterium]